MTARIYFLSVLVMGLTMLSSCAERSQSKSPQPQQPNLSHELPAQFTAQVTEQSADRSEQIPPWLGHFADEQLTTFIYSAWRAHPDVLISAARYEQALARAQQIGATRLPSVDVSGSVGRSRSAMSPGNTTYRTEYYVGAGLAWEIDVWGRLSSLARAENADTQAAQIDMVAAYRSLAAQVARAYYRLAFEQLRLSISDDALRIATHNEQLLTGRFNTGRSPAVDVHAARADHARAASDMAERKRLLSDAARQLEQLIGRYPTGELRVVSALPTPPPAPPAGVPAELLIRRPDILAAQQRFIASDERLASANADLLPRLSLTANGGYRSNELRDLIDPENLVWNILGNITQPLFDGGRRGAVIDERAARVKELGALWAQTVIKALREVEQALAAHEFISAQLTHLGIATQESAAVVQQVRERYSDGLSDGLTLLREQRSALNNQVLLLQLQLDQVFVRLDLLLALGGETVPDEAQVIERARQQGTSP
jgi:outer membrane protein, multidrug efflux system